MKGQHSARPEFQGAILPVNRCLQRFLTLRAESHDRDCLIFCWHVLVGSLVGRISK
jgi:hypothetical protein